MGGMRGRGASSGRGNIYVTIRLVYHVVRSYALVYYFEGSHWFWVGAGGGRGESMSERGGRGGFRNDAGGGRGGPAPAGGAPRGGMATRGGRGGMMVGAAPAATR